ncbi:U3 small nucleolar RNA-associated protein 4 homolog [Hydra vulgaris]|uniref:U3 small nucleolar RNA-associated protein 4 homolog n=1 Tax=Hydra vulgaris TaxID=6087 RepID=UPI001F5E4E6D|nr:U3 small nucleolar RNA-associated protein 4 homolog [Hydra vulgaris]
MSNYKVHRVRFVDYKPRSINCAAFDNDSKFPKVAFSREDGSIEIRDPACNWTLINTIPGQEGRTVEHLAWCDGRLFSGGMNSEIIEWNLELLKPLYQQDSYGGSVWSLKFSYSKKIVAVGCEDGSIRLFDVLRNGIMYNRCLNKQEHRILSLSWSHDDLLIAAGGFDSKIRVYNVKSGRVSVTMTTDNLKSNRTMVWSVNFLKDSTIITGDSLGNTQFWDGMTGTLLQSFKSHLADVLAVAIYNDEKMVFTTGIDSKIVQFVLLQNEHKSSWIQTKHVRATQHDTRSLAICAEPYNCLVSGGIDPRFVVHSLNNFSLEKCVFYPCLPQSSVCQLAPNGNLLLFREQQKLNIWKMNHINNNDRVMPKKLFEIRANGHDHLICSAISHNGSYVAYSSLEKSQLFMLSVESSEGPSVQKIKLRLCPAIVMCFSNSEKLLITVNKSINITHINSFKTELIELDKGIDLPFRHIVISKNDEYVCIVDSKSKCLIFSLQERKYITSLPTLSGHVSCLNFHPKTNNLFVCTSDMFLYEFNIQEDMFMPWLFDFNKTKLLTARKKNEEIQTITFPPKNYNQIILQLRNYIVKINYGTKILFPDDEAASQPKKSRQKGVYKTIRGFKDIMFFEFNSLNELVIVERPFKTILKSLPDPLNIKKFGT